MSLHIAAGAGAIAETVLLPGDPLRAKFIAETWLEKPLLYNEIRGMFGYTGLFRGKRVSVQGTGMGMPSISIYVQELIREYGVRTLIRTGTAGALQPELRLGDVVLAMAASTDSSANRRRFSGMDFAPTADPELLFRAWTLARRRGLSVRCGGVLSSDSFYDDDDPDGWKRWARYGVLAVEMETSALYTIAARHGARALAILTMSDSLGTGEAATAEERQTSYRAMIELALDAVAGDQ